MPDDDAPRESEEDTTEDADLTDESAFDDLVDEIETEASDDTGEASGDDDREEPSEPADFEEITSTAELDLEDEPTDEDAGEEFGAFTSPEVAGQRPDQGEAAEESEPFDFDQLEDEADEPGDPGGSAFGDLLNRVKGAKPDTEETESRDIEQRATGQIARLEEQGVFEVDSRTLLLASSGSEDEHGACTSMMTHLPSDETNLMLVWLSRSAASRFGELLEGLDGRPAGMAIVTQRDTMRSINEGMVWDGDSFSMHTINDVADLTQVGITISQALSQWEDADQQTIVCIDSISDLLRQNSTERVFRFLHVLEGRLATVDATAHFHLDNRNHELQTIRTLQGLFDVSLEVTDEGITRVQ